MERMLSYAVTKMARIVLGLSHFIFIQRSPGSACQSNAAPEWQAVGFGWRSREIVEACPLEGLVSEPILLCCHTFPLQGDCPAVHCNASMQ
jgi:hypothetical protein